MKREPTRQRFLKAKIEQRNLRRGGIKPLQLVDADEDDKQLAARLLEQDDELPGNRNSGFRFNFLLVIMALTPLYLWFELSFGVHLLNTISGKTTVEETAAIEHWGRLITVWFRECEKRNKPWAVRILVTLAIFFVCIPLTWLTQGKVIDFYVKRGSTEIALDLAGLTLAVAIGFYLLRFWLRRCIVDQKHGAAMTVFGLAVILGTGVLFLTTTHLWLPQFNEKNGHSACAVETNWRGAQASGDAFGIAQRRTRRHLSAENHRFFAANGCQSGRHGCTGIVPDTRLRH